MKKPRRFPTKPKPKTDDLVVDTTPLENEADLHSKKVTVNQDEFVVNGSRVQVVLCRYLTGVYFLRVRLESKRLAAAGKIWQHADLEFDRNIEKRVEAAGGALAEEQNELHFDKHDPSECARAAKEAWRKLAMKMRDMKLIG